MRWFEQRWSETDGLKMFQFLLLRRKGVDSQNIKELSHKESDKQHVTRIWLKI